MRLVQSRFLGFFLLDEMPKPGKLDATATPHLMSRLCCAGVLATVSFLAHRMVEWSPNEDRQFKRLASYIYHHIDLARCKD